MHSDHDAPATTDSHGDATVRLRPATVEVSGSVFLGAPAPRPRYTMTRQRQVTWAELWALPSLRDAPIAGAELRHRR